MPDALVDERLTSLRDCIAMTRSRRLKRDLADQRLHGAVDEFELAGVVLPGRDRTARSGELRAKRCRCRVVLERGQGERRIVGKAITQLDEVAGARRLAACGYVKPL